MAAPTGSRGPRAAWISLLGAAFLLVAGFAARQTLSLRERQQEEAVRRAQSDLAAMIEVWQRSALQRSASWLTDLALSSEPARRERQLRRGTPTVDALFVWSTRPAAALVYPAPLRASAEPDPRRLAQQDLLDAAELLLLRDRPQAAWELLSGGPVPLYAPLFDPQGDGDLLRALLRRRLLAIDALAATGDRQRLSQLVERTAAEVVALPSPSLAHVLPWLDEPLLGALALHGDDAGATHAAGDALAAARRRAFGLVALRRNLGSLTSAATEEASEIAPRSEGDATTEQALDPADLLVDASDASRGVVLVYGLLPDGQRGVAVQWNADAMVDEILSTLPVEAALGEAVVLDAEGRILRGDPRCALGTPGDGRAVWVKIPLGSLLPEWRVGLCALPDRPAPHAGTGELLIQLIPIGGALLLGALAILARVSADRSQRALYDRQRAFITRVTHELKTPLAGIRIMAENLEIGAFRDAAQREMMAARIVGEVDRLGARIDEVLRVARADQPDRREPVALDALLRELAPAWQERFATVGARLELDLRPCAPVEADAALLRDAATNLLDNALKYRREDRPGLCRVSTREEGRWVVLEVTDDGLGVPPGQRKAIFEAFTRVEGPGRGKAGGHGLGLSFVAETARAHGGTVECRDGVDGGARFVLRFRRGR